MLENNYDISSELPCVVEEYEDENDKKLDLILYNISTRILNDSELWKSYEMLTEVLQNKKSAGEKFGRVKDNLAEKLNVSQGQISKMQKISNAAIPEVKEAIENGDVSIHTANQISKLSQDEQKELLSETPISEVTPKIVEEKTRAKKLSLKILLDDDTKYLIENATVFDNFIETFLAETKDVEFFIRLKKIIVTAKNQLEKMDISVRSES